jgi:DUF1365 family protein
MHQRLRPVLHRFVYPVCYVRLNLAQLDACNSRLFGVDRWRPLSIRRRDYGPRDGSSLSQWMRALLRSHGMEADGDIWLQTFPRIAGYAFNPISFWFCHGADGSLRAVLAEVNNTFGESHRYLLPVDANGATADVAKQLHVSPFCQLQGHYRFRFRHGPVRQFAAIDYHDADGLLIKTALGGRAVAMSERALLGVLLRFPLQGVGIVARIHWQALKLFLKRVPWFGKPPAPHHHTTVHQESVR